MIAVGGADAGRIAAAAGIAADGAARDALAVVGAWRVRARRAVDDAVAKKLTRYAGGSVPSSSSSKTPPTCTVTWLAWARDTAAPRAPWAAAASTEHTSNTRAGGTTPSVPTHTTADASVGVGSTTGSRPLTLEETAFLEEVMAAVLGRGGGGRRGGDAEEVAMEGVLRTIAPATLPAAGAEMAGAGGMAMAAGPGTAALPSPLALTIAGRIAGVLRAARHGPRVLRRAVAVARTLLVRGGPAGDTPTAAAPAADIEAILVVALYGIVACSSFGGGYGTQGTFADEAIGGGGAAVDPSDDQLWLLLTDAASALADVFHRGCATGAPAFAAASVIDPDVWRGPRRAWVSPAGARRQRQRRAVHDTLVRGPLRNSAPMAARARAGPEAGTGKPAADGSGTAGEEAAAPAAVDATPCEANTSAGEGDAAMAGDGDGDAAVAAAVAGAESPGGAASRGGPADGDGESDATEVVGGIAPAAEKRVLYMAVRVRGGDDDAGAHADADADADVLLAHLHTAAAWLEALARDGVRQYAMLTLAGALGGSGVDELACGASGDAVAAWAASSGIFAAAAQRALCEAEALSHTHAALARTAHLPRALQRVWATLPHLQAACGRVLQVARFGGRVAEVRTASLCRTLSDCVAPGASEGGDAALTHPGLLWWEASRGAVGGDHDHDHENYHIRGHPARDPTRRMHSGFIRDARADSLHHPALGGKRKRRLARYFTGLRLAKGRFVANAALPKKRGDAGAEGGGGREAEKKEEKEKEKEAARVEQEQKPNSIAPAGRGGGGGASRLAAAMMLLPAPGPPG